MTPLTPSILVLGDVMVDRYHISTQPTPIPSAEDPFARVWKVDRTFDQPGGAANVAANLRALGADQTVLWARAPYPIKNRLMWEGPATMMDPYHPILLTRWDQQDQCTPTYSLPTRMDWDGVVLIDYGKGALPLEVLEGVARSYQGPIFATTKGDPTPFIELFDEAGLTLFANEKEWAGFAHAYARASRLFVTRGANGAARLHRNTTLSHCPSLTPPESVVSVCGAGDTFLAAATYAILTFSPLDPLLFASAAAASVVTKPFTSTTTLPSTLQLAYEAYAQDYPVQTLPLQSAA